MGSRGCPFSWRGRIAPKRVFLRSRRHAPGILRARRSPMSLFRTTAAAALVGSLALNAFLAWRSVQSGQHVEVQLSAPDRIEVIRTPGGLLQVSTIKSPETFQATTDHRFLGIDLGQTTTQIRVPAVFNYHVELAPEWKVTVHGNAVLVIAPAIKPTLPVAIDTARLEKFSSGTWSLFTGPGELDALQRSITQTLALKAATPSYLAFQREFVAKWLLTQQRFDAGSTPSVRVFFADEPIDALARIAPVFLATPGKPSRDVHDR
jgi:hypothetical protein